VQARAAIALPILYLRQAATSLLTAHAMLGFRVQMAEHARNVSRENTKPLVQARAAIALPILYLRQAATILLTAHAMLGFRVQMAEHARNVLRENTKPLVRARAAIALPILYLRQAAARHLPAFALRDFRGQMAGHVWLVALVRISRYLEAPVHRVLQAPAPLNPAPASLPAFATQAIFHRRALGASLAVNVLRESSG
jgi:hypothetical protein